VSDVELTCKELVEIVTAYLDGALDTETHARFNAHLVYCDGCRNYLEQFRVTVRTLGRIHDDELDPDFRARLLTAFRDWK
jgi:anti-sigma factor RsiW